MLLPLILLSTLSPATPVMPAAPAPAVAAVAAAPSDDPMVTITLAMAPSGESLKLEYRQIGGDLTPYTEVGDEKRPDVHKRQVHSQLLEGGKLTSDLAFKVGEYDFPAGTYPLGFTVGVSGAAHLFLINGEKVVELTGDSFAPGWTSPHFTLQMACVSRTEIHLVWHLQDKAGSVKLDLGGTPANADKAADAAPATKAAPPAAPPATTPPADKPKGGKPKAAAPPKQN